MLKIILGFFSKWVGLIYLKRTLILALTMCTLIPLAVIGIISYQSLYQMQWERIRNGIQQNLGDVRTRLENSLNNLDYASRQLAYDGRVGDKMVRYLATDDVAEKYSLGNEITDSISLINFSNPDVGVMLYYFPSTDKVMFENIQIIEDFKLSRLPLFASQKGVTYYGPNKTAYKNSPNTVFAIARKLDIYQEECYIYIEMNFKLFEKLLNTKQYGLEVSHILVNSSNEIVYSELDNIFKKGTLFTPNQTQKSNEERDGYFIFKEASSQGWQVVAAIDGKVYNLLIYQWLTRFILLGALAVVMSLLFAFAIWEMVYRPLKYLNREMGLISQNKFDSEIRLTKIHEFNDLLKHFQYMKLKIVELIEEIAYKEKLKRQIEVEKLMHQINPHFLYNTLNSIQWLARLSGQDKIDRLVVLFTKILHYNLGKEGGIVTVESEVGALNAYVDLQRLRFDERLNVRIEADPETTELFLPRFILQPLVENAIFHGLKDEEGHILVSIVRDEGYLHVTVKDDGNGLDEEEIKKLLNSSGEHMEGSGLGIGLSYVNRVLKMYYEEEAELNVRSMPGEGTAFSLKIPVLSRKKLEGIHKSGVITL